MGKEFKEKLIEENAENVCVKNTFYEQMVKCFARLLYSNTQEYSQIEKYPVHKVEDRILEAKEHCSVQKYYFLAGVAMYMYHGRELRSRKGNPDASFSAALWFMELIGMDKEGLCLG